MRFENENERMLNDEENVELKDEQMTGVTGGWNKDQLKKSERKHWEKLVKKSQTDEDPEEREDALSQLAHLDNKYKRKYDGE